MSSRQLQNHPIRRDNQDYIDRLECELISTRADVQKLNQQIVDLAYERRAEQRAKKAKRKAIKRTMQGIAFITLIPLACLISAYMINSGCKFLFCLIPVPAAIGILAILGSFSRGGVAEGYR